MNIQRNLGLAVLAAAALLGGCSSDDSPSAPSPLAGVPGSASTSSAGLSAYLASLVATTDADLAEPLDVSAFTPPAGGAVDLEDPAAI